MLEWYFSLSLIHISKAQELDKAKKIDIAKSMLDKINTNYLESEVLRLLSTITEYKVEAMDAFPKVFYSGKIDGVFYEVPVTLNDMSTQMHTFLYPTETYTPVSYTHLDVYKRQHFIQRRRKQRYRVKFIV